MYHFKCFLFFCLIFWGWYSGSVFGQTILGAREVGLGGAVTALPNDAWAVFDNPAMMNDSAKSIDFFAMRYYGLKDLTDYSASITFPTKMGVFGAGSHTYGGKLFRKSRMRLGYMYEFSGVHLGLAVNYTDIYLPSPYGSAGAVGIDLGLAAKIMRGTWLGARSVNINNPQLGASAESLPHILAIGISYHNKKGFLITSEVYKDSDFPTSIRAGLEGTIVKILRFRAGITTEPVTYAIGMGIYKDYWHINLVTQKHDILGWSPGIEFAWNW